MHDLPHDFTNRKVSPWGGVKFFQQTYERCGLRDFLLAVDELPRPGSNRGYDPVDLIEGFMTSAVLGARRMAHSGMLRTDEVIREIFNWKKGMASQSTFSRFFSKFDLKMNDELFSSLQKFWFSQINAGRLTIDIDSTVITRYGEQQGASVGYNPKKHGRPSHHPIMAFCAELNMVVDAWMREGKSHDSAGMDCFVLHVLEIVSKERIGLMRLDRGFYDHKIMHDLEDHDVDYIIKAKLTGSLRERILEQTRWYGNGHEQYTEFTYQGAGWLRPRRFVATRKVKRTSDEENGQAVMFREDADLKQYEYAAFVTNGDLSAELVKSLYDKRADCENRIRELKYDYGIDGFAMKSMPATEAAFRFIMVAYNIMALFKQRVLNSPKGRYLSTVRFQCIAIGSYMVRSGRRSKMKLAAEGKRRHFLEHLFKNVDSIKPPFQFSNA
jgi:hypothetical protein